VVPQSPGIFRGCTGVDASIILRAVLDYIRDLIYLDGILSRYRGTKTKHHRISGRKAYSCLLFGIHIYPLEEWMKNLKWDAEALLESYTRALPKALDALDPEKRHAQYRMLRLRMLAYPDGMLEVSGIFE